MVPDWKVGEEVRGKIYRPFTPAWLRRSCEQAGTTELASVGESLYPHADRGEAIEVTGSVWRCCPAWYARFNSRSSIAAALRAFELHTWRESNALSSVTRGLLLAWQVTLIGVVGRARAARARREYEAARRSAQEDS